MTSVIQLIEGSHISPLEVRWTSQDDKAEVRITSLGITPTGQPRYKWHVIMSREMLPMISVWESDLYGPAGGKVDTLDMMATWCGFLGAWVEAWAYPNSENGDLFPDRLAPFAEQYADDMQADMSSITEDVEEYS